jgi:hypothetical protein
MSRSGRWALFHTSEGLIAADTNGLFDVYLKDLYTGELVLISATEAGAAGNGASTHGSFSGDERWVVFTSMSTNLTADVDGNTGSGDIYVLDRDSDNDGVFDEVGATAMKQLTLTAPGAAAGNGDSQGATLSNTGRYVAIRSGSSNLTGGDSNGINDAFRLDRDSDGDGIFDEAGDYTWLRVSLTSGGNEATAATDVPRISGSGDRIVIRTQAPLVAADINEDWDAYLVNISAEAALTVTLISVDPANGSALGSVNHVRITRDGNWVTFDAIVTTNIGGSSSNRDVFLYKVSSAALQRVSLAFGGTTANGSSSNAYPVANGSTVYIVFDSTATDLVAGDTNNVSDVFLWTSTDNAATNTITREVAAEAAISLGAGISEDGTLLLATSETSLNPADTNNIRDLYTLRRS